MPSETRSGRKVAMSLSTNDDNLEVFRLIVDQGPDAVIFADRQGKIRVWNNAAADLFGYPAEEVIGRSLDIIIPEHLRHAHWEGFGRAIASGHTKHGGRALKTRATHKSGKKLYDTRGVTDGFGPAQWRRLASLSTSLTLNRSEHQKCAMTAEKVRRFVEDCRKTFACSEVELGPNPRARVTMR